MKLDFGSITAVGIQQNAEEDNKLYCKKAAVTKDDFVGMEDEMEELFFSANLKSLTGWMGATDGLYGNARIIEVEANGKKYLGVIYNDNEQVDIYYDSHMDESSDDDATRSRKYGLFQQDLWTIYDGAGDYTVTVASGLTDDCITTL